MFAMVGVMECFGLVGNMIQHQWDEDLGQRALKM